MEVPTAAMLTDRDGEREVAVELISKAGVAGPLGDPVGTVTDFAGLWIDPEENKVELEYGPTVE